MICYHLLPPSNRCTMADIETALSVGLIRVGVQMNDFKSRPKTKSFISCQVNDE